jgi:DNA polymerase type B, organellar and viral
MINLSWASNNEIVKKRYSIDFIDSLLLLPISLRKLAKAFEVEFKGFFPFSFINKIDTSLEFDI